MPRRIRYGTAYFTVWRMMRLSCPASPTAAVAMTTLCGESIFMAELPALPAEAIDTSESPGPCALSFWRCPNWAFDEATLPVRNLPKSSHDRADGGFVQDFEPRGAGGESPGPLPPARDLLV